MNKKNNGQEIVLTDEKLLTDLSERIRAREAKIDEHCDTAVAEGLEAIKLAFEQGDDLTAAKSRVMHGQWEEWLALNFPKADRTARRYMQLAEIPKGTRMAVLKDAKSVNEAFRMLGIIPQEPQKTAIDCPTITIPPEIQKLNWIAEWVARGALTLDKLPPIAREELKAKLRPVVEVFNKL